jgi:hypothetical protein
MELEAVSRGARLPIRKLRRLKRIGEIVTQAPETVSNSRFQVSSQARLGQITFSGPVRIP